ncbi:MAG TPA: hypothetical protein V6D22_10805 [Candidatus Obscuribacterales bacterium]
MITRSQLLGFVLLGILTTSPAQALQTPTQILQSLQNQAPAGLSGHATVMYAGSEIIASIAVSQATSDVDLRKFAAELAARILGDASSHIDRLTVVYEGSAVDRVKSICIERTQWLATKDSPNAASQLEIIEGERAVGDFKPTTVAAAMPSSNNPYENLPPPDEVVVLPAVSHAPPEVANQRAKIIERLELLQKKGVGVHPYMAILNESEENFKKGNMEAGKECLAKLDQDLKDQEKQLSSRSTVKLKSGVSQSVAFQTLPPPPSLVPGATAPAAAGAASPNLKAGTPTSDELFRTFLGNHSVTELKGSETNVATTLATQLLKSTLGEDCPNDGPFLFERIRVATRIHELFVKKVDVSSYRMFNRERIESLIQTKDPRSLRIIADNIKYLERQLGLEQLEKNDKGKK